MTAQQTQHSLGRLTAPGVRLSHGEKERNYRIYNKQEGKTKNDYLQEMITEVLDWDLKPKTVTNDTWYSSQENLNLLKTTRRFS